MISTAPEVDALLDSGAPLLICSSGGKDSQCAAEQAVAYARARNHTGDVVLVYSDLGRVVWADAMDQNERLAARLGIPLQTVKREAGGLMERWQKRWIDNVDRYVNLSCVKVILPWSTPSMRFCTSELKTAIIQRWIRKTYKQPVVCVLGIRRDEGTSKKSGRGAAPIFKLHTAKAGKKANLPEGSVDWNCIVDVKTEKVFQIMRARPEVEQPSSYGFGAERFSCALCMMAKKIDLKAATRDSRNHPIYREQCELEIASTFSFQDKQWLSDIAPELLTEDQRTRLALAKVAAEERAQTESVIPKHLLYVKGWPTVMPTQAEAELLAEVRREIGRVMGLDVKYTEANEVLGRYAELMALKESR
jgi:hypothetical protein